MSDMMRAIAILQAVRCALENTPHYTTIEPFCFADEIQQLQEAITMLSHLHDERERLRNLRPEDVTKKHVAAWLMVDEHAITNTTRHRHAMSAAVRVMSASLDKLAEDFDK